MNLPITQEEQNKLSQLFFFLQDISLELQADSAIFNIVEKTYEDKDFLIYESKISNVKNSILSVKLDSISKDILPILAKVAFQNIILCICRAHEAVDKTKSDPILEKYCPESRKLLKRHLNRHYKNVVAFRNTYVAHPLDRNTNDFVSIDNLITHNKRIIGINDDQELSIGDFLGYVKKLHFMDVTDPKHSFTWAIHKMSVELKANGVILERV